MNQALSPRFHVHYDEPYDVRAPRMIHSRQRSQPEGASATATPKGFETSETNSQNLDPLTNEPGAHPAGTGVGATAGAFTGAAAGSVIGPLGMIAGGVIGAIAGGLAGKEVAENANPTEGGAPSEHKLGAGVGASAGALAGASIGSIGGPLGVAAGAAFGCTLGWRLG